MCRYFVLTIYVCIGVSYVQIRKSFVYLSFKNITLACNEIHLKLALLRFLLEMNVEKSNMNDSPHLIY